MKKQSTDHASSNSLHFALYWQLGDVLWSPRPGLLMKDHQGLLPGPCAETERFRSEVPFLAQP